MKNQSFEKPIKANFSDNEPEMYEVMMSEVESRNMPSLSTSGWEIASILISLFILLGVLYGHR